MILQLEELRPTRIRMTLRAAEVFYADDGIDFLAPNRPGPNGVSALERLAGDPYFLADFLVLTAQEAGNTLPEETAARIADAPETRRAVLEIIVRELARFLPDPIPDADKNSNGGGKEYSAKDAWETIAKMAGALGVDLSVSRISLRQLAALYRGRLEDAWGIASCLMALIANCNRDPKTRPRPFKPEDFNPTVPPKKNVVPYSPQNWETLKKLMTKSL